MPVILLTIPEAAQWTHRPPATIYRWMNAGLLHPVHVGTDGLPRVSVAELEAIADMGRRDRNRLKARKQPGGGNNGQ